MPSHSSTEVIRAPKDIRVTEGVQISEDIPVLGGVRVPENIRVPENFRIPEIFGYTTEKNWNYPTRPEKMFYPHISKKNI